MLKQKPYKPPGIGWCLYIVLLIVYQSWRLRAFTSSNLLKMKKDIGIKADILERMNATNIVSGVVQVGIVGMKLRTGHQYCRTQ